jgi:POT family proton-dependent oligopeptide transporter
MKSLVMAAWLFTVSLGNAFTAALNFLIPALRQHSFNLEGAAYFRFFTCLMLITAVIFVFVGRFYRGKSYIQGEDSTDAAAAG